MPLTMKHGQPLFNLGFLLAAVISCYCMQVSAQQIRPHVYLPDEPVRSAIFESCSSCHGIDEYAYYALDRMGWQALLADKHNQGSSLRLSDKNRDLMLDYLAENFGPQSVPFPREYVPPEVVDYFDDSDARVFLEQTCAECHEIRVFGRKGTEQEWRELVFEMRENGASLSDENLERLVEWLARTRGPVTGFTN